MVPDMDLWVPVRQNTSQPQRGGTRGCSGHPAAFTGPSKESEATQGYSGEASSTAVAPRELSQRETPSGIHSTVPGGVQDPHSADTHPASLEEPASEVGPGPPGVPLGIARGEVGTLDSWWPLRRALGDVVTAWM